MCTWKPDLIMQKDRHAMLMIISHNIFQIINNVENWEEKIKLLWQWMSRLMTKPTKWSMRPAKTQSSLGIHQVWSVFTVCMKKHWVLSYPLSALWRLWSDWADAQADLSLRRVHMPFCSRWFCCEAAQLLSRISGLWLPYIAELAVWLLLHRKALNWAMSPENLSSWFATS